MPSYSESFGLVAVEAQACATPVVASSVGGLRTAVADGVSGVLISSHDPVEYSQAIGALISKPERLHELSVGARMHASTFGWSATTTGLIATYRAALANRQSSTQLTALPG